MERPGCKNSRNNGETLETLAKIMETDEGKQKVKKHLKLQKLTAHTI